ncbi:DUF4291 domain-containing protein [Actinoalloteichus hymeniacidonis]|uniref:DUF4291 family protein n=1 Tax=Actinoalloteichus hymeniacidonis TaxID=340345 RepID=A0AAC9MX16_9PSEU|nr:DUF4291 domain-containing protein [Actinoalloteichus hymeniacidonis]AOS61576.1 putative DUF4291 family protein [Actinoalloteichus hymeniacidonis]MBB5910414.1 hypothetical protein [Actinoalloteichus hymeniacidonis]
MEHRILANHDAETVVVYQAYSPLIAKPALAAGTFVPPFSRTRMTWIKPSFRWMMHRSGWALKPDQEVVLAITLKRSGFDWAVRNACPSSFREGRDPDQATWRRRLAESPVRIQWDPDRGTRMERLDTRAIQLGLRGVAVEHYVDDWIVGLADVTPLAHEIHRLVSADRLTEASALLPVERPYQPAEAR